MRAYAYSKKDNKKFATYHDVKRVERFIDTVLIYHEGIVSQVSNDYKVVIYAD